MRRVYVLFGLGASSILAACAGPDHTVTGPQSPSVAASSADHSASGVARVFGRHQRLMIADQFNNRVIEINRQGEIVWHFGRGPNDVSANSIIGTNDAQPVGHDLVLMAGTGAPAGTEPLCPKGCLDNRVLLVNRAGEIVWQYGQFGVTGADRNQLSGPVQATYLANGHILITDQGNERIIEVDRGRHVVWQYGQTGVIGHEFNQLNNPNAAELLENGHILISDENNNRAIEVTRARHIVATFTGHGTVSGVAFASRLSNGHTLITDSNNNRIVEVDGQDNIVWQYATNAQRGSNSNPLPTRALRLETGLTLISDQFNDRVIAVDHDGRIVESLGHLNKPGFGTHDIAPGLNAPYDAKVVGDFTGITSPFQDGDHDADDGA